MWVSLQVNKIELLGKEKLATVKRGYSSEQKMPKSSRWEVRKKSSVRFEKSCRSR